MPCNQRVTEISSLHFGFLRCALLSLSAMSEYVELGDAALSAAEVAPDVVAGGAALIGGGVATGYCRSLQESYKKCSWYSHSTFYMTFCVLSVYWSIILTLHVCHVSVTPHVLIRCGLDYCIPYS